MSLEDEFNRIRTNDENQRLRTQASALRNVLEQVHIALQEDDIDEAKSLLEQIFGDET